MSKNILGIDVSKRKIDVALIFDSKTLTKKFDNSLKGFMLLNGWLKSLHRDQVHACLEATGSYGDAVANFLHEAGHIVSVVNPFRIKGYATAKFQRNKTDRVDARLIADFCQTQNLDQWFPPSPEVVELQALTRRIEMLEEMLQMEQNRLDVSPKKTKGSIRRITKTLEKEIEDLKANIKDHINQNPDLKEQVKLLETIPGIAEKTAYMLVAEIDFSRYDSARQIAAYAGVVPRRRESGTSLNYTTLSKQGNGRIRKGLYFPAIVAKQHNKLIAAFAKRLEKNGKTPMQIICAAMRKLLHIAFGVLKHKTPFNPNLAFNR